MRINTNKKTVSLDKREMDRLRQAKDILDGLEKHAGGDSGCAETRGAS